LKEEDMFKLANQVIDAYDDVNKTHLTKVAKLNPQIYMLTPAEKDRLHDDDFALSIITKKASKLNKFPVNTHDSTWLSNQYFDLTSQRLPKLASATAAYFIKQACEKFNITPLPAVVGLAKEASSNIYYEEDLPADAATTKNIHVDLSKFAQVEQIGDNYTFAQYAFPTVSHVKLACQYLEKYIKQIPVDYRHKYAAAIQKRAQELGMGQQGGIVSKYASDYYSGHVDAHLRARASLLETADPKFRGALDKLSAMKKEMSATDFARLLHGFDKRAGLTKYYDSALTDPYQAVFAQEPTPYGNYTAKMASGASLTADEIRKVSIDKYAKIKEYFGHNIADELKSHGIPIFESLPNDAKEIIASIASGEL
jgi:hypothetical protein